MAQLRKFIVPAVIAFVLVGCEPVDQFPEHMVALESETDPIVIDPPCEYDDYVELSGETGMQGGNSLSINESFDYTDLVFRFYRSANTVNISYINRYGLKAITSEVVDLARNSKYSMNVSFWDGSSRSMAATSGKLYIEVLGEDRIKFTWCDVNMYDSRYDINRTCKGGYIVKF